MNEQRYVQRCSNPQDHQHAAAIAPHGGDNARATLVDESKELDRCTFNLSRERKTCVRKIAAWTTFEWMISGPRTCAFRAAPVVLCAPHSAAVIADSGQPTFREWLAAAHQQCTRRVILLQASIA